MVAVLPFEDLDTPDSELERLVQDDLSTMFSRQEDLRALALTAIDYAHARNYSPQNYAESYGVTLLFEGSFRKKGPGYQVNIRMVWSESGLAVWRRTLETTDQERETLVRLVLDNLEPFIKKKVAYLRARQS